MKLLKNRRIILAIGAALLVGGWGMTRLAHERVMHYPTEHHRRVRAWYEQGSTATVIKPSGFFVTPRTVYIIGVVGMAAGAGFIGFAALRKSE